MIGTRPVALLGGVAFIAVAVGCARTEPEPASPSITQVRQVAYLKAANPDMGDHFACGGSLPGHIGSALAISTDGNTVVVGAPHESSAARGINGNAADNSLYNSGAVYVFVRRGGAWVQQAYVKASNAGQSDLFGMTVSLTPTAIRWRSLPRGNAAPPPASTATRTTIRCLKRARRKSSRGQATPGLSRPTSRHPTPDARPMPTIHLPTATSSAPLSR